MTFGRGVALVGIVTVVIHPIFAVACFVVGIGIMWFEEHCESKHRVEDPRFKPYIPTSCKKADQDDYGNITLKD